VSSSVTRVTFVTVRIRQTAMRCPRVPSLRTWRDVYQNVTSIATSFALYLKWWPAHKNVRARVSHGERTPDAQSNGASSEGSFARTPERRSERAIKELDIRWSWACKCTPVLSFDDAGVLPR